MNRDKHLMDYRGHQEWTKGKTRVSFEMFRKSFALVGCKHLLVIAMGVRKLWCCYEREGICSKKGQICRLSYTVSPLGGQVKFRYGSNLKSILSLTLVDVKLVFSYFLFSFHFLFKQESNWYLDKCKSVKVIYFPGTPTAERDNLWRKKSI